MTVIKMNSGILFDVTKPDPAKFKIKDFAHALSGIHRFGAHAKRYTVAEHCIRGSYMAMNPRDAIIFLLHEGGEGIMGIDVPKPIKDTIKKFETLDESLNDFVLNKVHNLQTNEEDIQVLNNLDRALLEVEMKELYGDTYYRPMSTSAAKKYFLKRYYELVRANDLQTQIIE